MAQYEYIQKGGGRGTIDAASSDEALKKLGTLSDVETGSGVQEVKQSTTPTTPATPVPTPETPTPQKDSTSTQTRYSRVGQLEGELDASRLPAPDETTIRTQKREQAQGLIDAVNARFDRELTAERSAGNERNARVRALNIAGGLGGSNFASAAATKQEDKNRELETLIQNQRDAEIQAILSDVENRASEEYQARRKEYRAEIEGDLERARVAREEDRQTALNSLAGIASAGITFEAFKLQEPDLFKQLQGELGGSEFALRAAWNEALPDNMRIQYTTQVQKNKDGNAVIHRYGVNPITGKLDDQYEDTGVSYEDFTGEYGVDEEILFEDGTFYAKSKNNDGTITLNPITTTPKTMSEIEKNRRSGGSSDIYNSGSLSLTQDALNEISQGIENSKGTDGYVNPELYQETYDDWIANGGLGKDFLLKFPPKTYVNPANDTLPLYLRSNKSTKSSGRSLNP